MDRFQELSKIALDELSEVFARMSDENVRELLEEIKKADRIFLLGAGREGLSTREFAMRLMHLGRSLIGYGKIQLHQWAKVICSSVHAEAQTWRMKIYFVTMQRKPAQRFF